MSKNFISIVGVPRSGTTWVWGLFESLPRVHTLTKFPGASESYVYERRGEAGAKKLIEHRLSMLPEHHLLVEKTPHHLMWIDVIKKSFPDSKIVLVTRDAKDVVASLLNSKRFKTNFTDLDFNKALSACIEFAVLAAHHADKISATISYESLSRSPRFALNVLLEQLDLSYSLEEVEQAVSENHGISKSEGNFRKGVVGSHKDELTDREIDLIDSLFTPAGTWKGSGGVIQPYSNPATWPDLMIG